MKYQKWSKIQLLKQKRELLKRLGHTPTEEDFITLQAINDLLHGSNIAEPVKYQVDNFNILKNANLYWHVQYHDFIPAIKKFYNTAKDYKPLPRTIHTSSLSDKELLNLTDRFFFNYFREFYNYFYKVFKEKNKNIIFKKDIRSFTNWMPSLEYFYMCITRNHNITDLSNAVHEYAHTINKLYHPHDTVDSYPYLELFSLLCEMELVDFMQDEYSTMYYNDLLLYRGKVLDMMCQFSHELLLEEAILDSYDQITSEEDAISILSTVRTADPKLLKSFYTQSAYEKFSYLIPYLVDIELYSMFKGNPKEAFEITKYIMSLDSDTEYFTGIKNSGIVLNKHTPEFINSIIIK